MGGRACRALVASPATCVVAAEPLDIGSRAELFVDRHPTDGIHWKRPSLGLFEFAGSKDNNIIWRNESAGEFEGYSSCFMVARNDNPAAKPEERSIAMAHSQREGKTPDGLPISISGRRTSMSCCPRGSWRSGRP
jgi:hypothetical protein